MIVLDTHVWIWWMSNPEQLSKTARLMVDEAAAENDVFISSISAWEVAMMVARDRLRLTMSVGNWVAASETMPFINFVPVSNSIAVKSIQLPGNLHHDPADRIIIATALSMGAVLVTKDEKIRSYPHIKSAW